MIQLLLMLFIGLLFLCLALFALLRTSKASEGHSDSQTELLRMLHLSSLEFDFTNLFSDDDYRFLASEPKLHSVARELRKDRKAIALEWLGELRKDAYSLWRFRAYLTRLGISASVHDELAEAIRSLSLLFVLSIVRVSVKLFGPFAFGRIAICMRAGVEKIKQSCATTLDKLPSERWPQIAADWQSAQAI